MERAIQEDMIELAKEMPEMVVVINYESWYRSRKVLDWLLEVGFDGMIVDESHRAKETNKLPYKGVRELALTENKCKHCDRIVYGKECATHYQQGKESSVKTLICMSGTPILNRPDEIFAPLSLIEPNVFDKRNQFMRMYADYSGEGWGYGGQERLAKEISGMYIRRTLDSAGIELPPQEVTVHEITVDKKEYPLQAEALTTIWQNAQLEYQVHEQQGTANFTSVLPLITRMRQASTWPGGIWINKFFYDMFGQVIIDPFTDKPKVERIHVGQNYHESAKLDYAVDLYEELVSSGHRVVFFSQFTEALKEMQRRLGDEVALYTGETPHSQRDLIKNNFDASINEEPKWQGVLCHYATGGVGLTLTSATAMIILDEAWNQGTAQQAFDRIHRIGQERKTQVHILRHVGPQHSIDKWVAGLIESKADMVNNFDNSVSAIKELFKSGELTK